MSSVATESTPPESARVSLAPPGTWRASSAATRAARSLGGRFLELAIAHQPLEARFDELGGALVGEAPQRVLQRLLQALRRGRVVAMGAAERLVHDFVDQAERLQPVGSDAERLGRLRRHLGVL